uniref:Zinc finger protein 865 n=1 Tax=Dicentrarchus labrax TaxID=13489 RepID=A0A8C4IC11_DICLA
GPRRFKKNYDCPTCGRVFSHNTALQRHLVIHSGKRPFKCFICGRGFTQSGNLKTHMKVHRGKTVCGFTLPNWTLVQEKSPLKESPVTVHVCGDCSVCGKDFPYASKLQRHLRTHSGERPFPCSMCEKRFPEKGLLMIHERVHTGEKPFPCTFCEKRFASQGELRLHRRTHTGERPYHCSICLKSFSRHWHLKTHLEAMHSEVVAGFTRKKFPCSDCDKSCNSAAELRDHQRTHTGERPYQCSFCDKRFALSGTLVRHERLHTGITPYHCSDCGKTFAQQWTLTTHMRTHTGEKPYSCTQCDKSFVVSDSQSLPSAVEPHSSESLNCDKAAQCESNLREPEDRREDVTPCPHMNVIVKEEEEEEPLCGT